jgi:hypothetical protein
MTHSKFRHLPTRLNAENAWEAYSALVCQANANPDLFGDFKHCQAMTRAYRRWSRLFLAMDEAA